MEEIVPFPSVSFGWFVLFPIAFFLSFPSFSPSFLFSWSITASGSSNVGVLRKREGERGIVFITLVNVRANLLGLPHTDRTVTFRWMYFKKFI